MPASVGRRLTRAPLRIVPPRAYRVSRSSASRTPFVMLVLTLLGAGLVGLLVLNAAAIANSDRQRDLRAKIDQLRDSADTLERRVTAKEAPRAILDRARELGMVPSGEPGFLVLDPDGGYHVVGTPEPAPEPPPEPESDDQSGDE